MNRLQTHVILVCGAVPCAVILLLEGGIGSSGFSSLLGVVVGYVLTSHSYEKTIAKMRAGRQRNDP